MSRIVFLSPFPPEQTSGGIKNCYRHAELLTELGADASVYQPGGPPAWFKTHAKMAPMNFVPTPDDIVVFPEALVGWLAEMAQANLPARKFLFCQNQYIAANTGIPAERFAGLGFARTVCSSDICAGVVRRVLHLDNVMTVPCYIDASQFKPAAKTMQIALAPRKMTQEAGFIRVIFEQKYPQLRHVPWVAIHDHSESETADILGRSAVFLALSQRESLGLMPLEAMASGCVVAGFHGYGGLEYASDQNGFWLRPDYLEETADALAALVQGLTASDPALAKIRAAGMATAARFNRETTVAALSTAYVAGA